MVNEVAVVGIVGRFFRLASEYAIMVNVEKKAVVSLLSPYITGDRGAFTGSLFITVSKSFLEQAEDLGIEVTGRDLQCSSECIVLNLVSGATVYSLIWYYQIDLFNMAVRSGKLVLKEGVFLLNRTITAMYMSSNSSSVVESHICSLVKTALTSMKAMSDSFEGKCGSGLSAFMSMPEADTRCFAGVPEELLKSYKRPEIYFSSDYRHFRGNSLVSKLILSLREKNISASFYPWSAAKYRQDEVPVKPGTLVHNVTFACENGHDYYGEAEVFCDLCPYFFKAAHDFFSGVRASLIIILG